MVFLGCTSRGQVDNFLKKLLQAIRPLQLVQNAAARLIFNLPKFTHVTPLLRSLHWLPVVARIRFKTLMLAYKAKNRPAPPYLTAMVKSRAVPRALRASSTARLEPPSLRTHGRQASRLFSVLAPRWWNELPLSVRTAESLAVFKRRLKTHLFVKHVSTSTGPLFGQCLSSCVLIQYIFNLSSHAIDHRYVRSQNIQQLVLEWENSWK
ncbi:hypothetical protein NFI96_000207 [Prochilodus magdalenae]|nr:hypothetical protein NFI96_000207 [Prochilodus magdalenae]